MAESFPVDSGDYSQFNFKNKSPEIPPNESVTVQMPILSGLFNCGKYLPLKYLQGLTIEFVMVSNHKDAALKIGETDDFEPKWEITEPVIKCQRIFIDDRLEHELTQR